MANTLSKKREIAILGATGVSRMIDSADVDNIVGNSTYLNARNLVHNGAMYVDQRNEGAAVTPANATVTYGPDRWYMYKNTAATFTIEQDTEAPAGFKYSLKVTNTGTDSSISATDRAIIVHRLEGQDLYHLGLGTHSMCEVL